MTIKKPERIKDKIWDQHLRWLGLVSNECKSNQLKQERQKQRQQSGVPDPGEVTRPSAG